ncbi:MAG: hypothetical protein Q4D91_09580 [Lautropia sp.]|nr:hypothetical protein [Lautropia sp.]
MFACVGWGLSAKAQLHEVSYTLHRDGSEAFDASDAPGHDSGPNNQRVRTHDTLAYHVGLNTRGADQAPRIELRLPAGSHGTPAAAWSFLPVGCEANGSSLSADGQQLICQLSDFEATGSRTLFFVAHILGSTPNGTRLNAPDLRVSSRKTPLIQPSTPRPPTVTISAAPFYDVQIDNSFQGLPKAHGYAEGSGPAGEDGFYHRPLIGLIARHPNGHGKKGVEQLDPNTPVVLDLDLSGYRPSVRVDDWHGTEPTAHRPSGSFADGCGSPNDGRPSNLSSGDRINAYERVHDSGPNPSTSPQSVANGGDCRVLPGSNRHSVRIAISGIDSRLDHTPSVYGGGHLTIPPTDHWVANKALVLWTSLNDYADKVPTDNLIRLRSVQGRSISGQALQGDRHDNNAASYAVTRESSSEFMSNYGSDNSLAIPWATQRDPVISSDDHVNQMVPGQVVRAFMRYSNSGTVAHHNVMLCQKIDRTAFDPSQRFQVVVSAPGHAVVQYGVPANGSRFFPSTDSAPSAYEGYTAETRSSPGDSAYSQARCDTPDIQWFTRWQDAEAAGGVVYVRIHAARVPGGGNIFAHVYGMQLRDTWADDISVQTPVPHLRRKGEPIAAGSIIRNQTIVHVDNHPIQPSYRLRDHLAVVPIRTHSQLKQRVLTGNQGAQAIAAANSLLSFELTPSYSTYFPARPGTLRVTNVLPAGLRYQKGSARLGGQPVEPDILPDTPAVGMTTLTWQYAPRAPVVLTNTSLDTSVPPITFQARLHATLLNDTVLMNHASVSGGENDHQPDCIFDPAAQRYAHCVKAASTRITIQTPPGFMQGKSVLRERIEPGDPFGYRLSFVSMGQETQAQDIPDMIDILPFEGDGIEQPALQFSARQPASRLMSGAYRLQSVIPAPIDPQARIYYTRQAPTRIHNDPQHASNRMPGGSTRWCLASELGTEGCPAHIGDSTAVRISPALRLLHPNTLYEVRLNLLSDPVLSRPGDIFANRVALRPADPNSPLLLNTSMSDVQVQVIGRPGGGLSGRLFVDLDQNLTFDADDQGLPRQCIQLDGQSERHGHRFSLSTLTDPSGHFAFTPGQTQRIHYSADCSGSPLPHFPGLPAGKYTLIQRTTTERHLAGASLAGNLGGTAEPRHIHDITLPAGAIGTDYRLTEQPAPAELTLRSTVTNDHGGTATAAAFELMATQETTDTRYQGADGSAAVTRRQLPAGPYTLSTHAVAGYAVRGWQCTLHGQQAPAQGSRLNLKAGDQAECTVHLDDLPARLTLRKTVTNSHGQQAQPEDFKLHADGPTPLSGYSGAAAVTAREVVAGHYRLHESNLPNYVPGAWQCTAGTLDEDRLSLTNGEAAVCTINNTDQPVSLTLTLAIRNQYGGTATPADHELRADGPDAIRGISGTRPVTVAPVRPGVYELGQPSLPGYLSGQWACSGGVLNGNTLTLSNQQNVTCRIELKDVPATLSVKKTVVGEATPIAGTDSDYALQYRLTVRHEAGAPGRYDLLDQPAFDPDVQIIETRLSRNGRPIPLDDASEGFWLARRQDIATGAEDVYLMHLRIRVPYGSHTGNNRCAPLGQDGPHEQHGMDAGQRQGLFNQARLTNHMADTDRDARRTAHACLDTPIPSAKARLSIDKTSTTRTAEVGELIRYQLRIRNHGSGPAVSPVVIDTLPAGFRYDPGSLRVAGARLRGLRLDGQRALHIHLDQVSAAPDAHVGHRATSPVTGAPTHSTAGHAPGEVIIRYRLRAGVGSQEGDGINRAQVSCLTPDGLGRYPCSNEARWAVKLTSGVFTEEACLVGQIFVDCNGNAIKDPEEPGIPDVRFYLQNGTWLRSDGAGKYSHCGLRPRTHLLKVDPRTLPSGSRLVTSSAQNTGDAQSLFIDARKGMLHRADFIEGTCSRAVLNDVIKRQQKHEGQTNVGQPTASPRLWFDSKR